MSDINFHSNDQSEHSHAYSWVPLDPPTAEAATSASGQHISSDIPPTTYDQPGAPPGPYFDHSTQFSYNSQASYEYPAQPEPSSSHEKHYTPQQSQSLSVYVPVDAYAGVSKSTSISPSTALSAPSFVSYRTSSSTTPPERFSVLPNHHMILQPASSYAQDSVANYTHNEEVPLPSLSAIAPRSRAPRRREKPHIELANNQPLTTQGNARQRVYLACNQCRKRKARCDGGRPACLPCIQRCSVDAAAEPCSYDVAPTRRGKDKDPGGRQRGAQREVYAEGTSAPIQKPARSRRRPRADRGMTGDTLVIQDRTMNPQADASTLKQEAQVQQHLESVSHVFGPVQVSSTDVERLPRQSISLPVLLPHETNAPDLSISTHSTAGTVSHESASTYATHPVLNTSISHEGSVYTSGAYIEDTDGGVPQHYQQRPIYATPSFNWTRKTWWDSLLVFYDIHVLPVTGSTDISTTSVVTTQPHIGDAVVNSLKLFFRSSNYILSFFHIPSFWYALTRDRERLQPCLVLAMLSISVFFRSSQAPQALGMPGLRAALRLNDEAQALLQASINVGAIDEGLVQAAWLLAFFEMCAHPSQSLSRTTSAFVVLDQLIQIMGLMRMDDRDPYANRFHTWLVPRNSHGPSSSRQGRSAPTQQRQSQPRAGYNDQRSIAASYYRHQQPWVAEPLQVQAQEQYEHAPQAIMPSTSLVPTAMQSSAPPVNIAPVSRLAIGHSTPAGVMTTPTATVPSTSASSSVSTGCNCNQMAYPTSGGRPPETNKMPAPTWYVTPGWEWSDEHQLRNESMRRLVWSTVIIFGQHSSYVASMGQGMATLAVSKPENFALLFSGESLTFVRESRSSHLPDLSPKESMWALHYRIFMLWHRCFHTRNDRTITDDERRMFSMDAWLEADALERALERHTCGVEKSWLSQGKEYLSIIRLYMSYAYQQYIPLASAGVDGHFHRRKAEEWLLNQQRVAFGFAHIVKSGQAASTVLTRRPFFVYWFMGQFGRALQLWQCDHTLILALDVCKALMMPIEYLSDLWPCSSQLSRYRVQHYQLAEACLTCGQPIPTIGLHMQNYTFR